MCGFKTRCEDEFGQLFGLAREQCEEQFLLSLLLVREEALRGNRPTPIIPYIPNQEFQEMCLTVKSCGMLVGLPGLDSGTRLKLKLLMYCHLLEVDFYWGVIGNLLHILLKKEYQPKLFEDQVLGTKMKEMGKLFEELFEKWRTSGVRIGLDTIYNELCNNDSKTLRNRFSHGQYFIEGGNLFLTRRILDWSSKPKITYSSHEIDQLLMSRRTFLDVFEQTYHEAILPYQDGRDISTRFGLIRYDREHGRWVWAGHI